MKLYSYIFCFSYCHSFKFNLPNKERVCHIGFSVGIHHSPCLYSESGQCVWGIGMMQAFFVFFFLISLFTIFGILILVGCNRAYQVWSCLMCLKANLWEWHKGAVLSFFLSTGVDQFPDSWWGQRHTAWPGPCQSEVCTSTSPLADTLRGEAPQGSAVHTGWTSVKIVMLL